MEEMSKIDAVIDKLDAQERELVEGNQLLREQLEMRRGAKQRAGNRNYLTKSTEERKIEILRASNEGENILQTHGDDGQDIDVHTEISINAKRSNGQLLGSSYGSGQVAKQNPYGTQVQSKNDAALIDENISSQKGDSLYQGKIKINNAI